MNYIINTKFSLTCITIILTSLILSISALAAYGPRAYLYESVIADFDQDGSYDTGASFSPCSENPCAYGYMKVSVPNSDDVLQYLRLNVSNSSGEAEHTNLDELKFFRDTLTSYPTANSMATVNCNTTNSDTDTWYNVTNSNVAPPIKLKLTVVNYQGGNDTADDDDLFTTTNTLNFSVILTNDGTYNISSVTFGIQFELDTDGTRDAVNVSSTPSVTSGYGSATRTDSDSDDEFDQVNWTNGYIPPGTSVTIQFNATVADANWGSSTSEDMDGTRDDGVFAYHYNSSSTLSMMTITGKFSRGPIRQGVDMVNDSNGYWRVRGLIENRANSSVESGEQMLTYNITEWRIYEINPATGQPYSTPNQTGWFNGSATASQITPSSGRIYTTDSSRSNDTQWFNSTSQTKLFYTVYFNWSVLWNDTGSENYWSYINSTLDMPVLYRIDMTNTEADDGIINPDTGGDIITINHTTQHSGNTNIQTDEIEIYAVIPANTTTGDHHGSFYVNDIANELEVWYYNGSWYELDQTDPQLTVTVADPNETSDGYVNVSISDLSAVDILGNGPVGDNMSLNDMIRVRFQVVSNVSMTTGDTYNFTGNATHYTESGTPIREPLSYKTIQVSATRLTGYKDLVIEDPTEPTLINASINVTVEGNTISGIKFIDYVPQDALSGFNMSANATVYHYNSSGLFLWTEGVDYEIINMGSYTLSDGTNVTGYIFNNTAADGWSLEADEWIFVNYTMNVTQTGLYILPVEISAFDPATGLDLSTRFTGAITVVVPEPLLPISIEVDDIKLSKVIVGKPAFWTQSIEVFNPNNRPTKARFNIPTFEDATDAYASYINDIGEKVEETISIAGSEERSITWETVLQALETRQYELTVLTPPIMEVDRDVQVLEQIEDKSVKLKMDIFLKSFAKEDYQNIRLNLPMSFEKIIKITDGFGNQLAFSGSATATTIIIPEIKAGEMVSVNIIYKESYPVIIITPDRDRYDLESPVSLEILVINGGERLEYPYIETEVYTPYMDVIHSAIQDLEEMEPLEKTEVYEKFIIPINAPKGTYIATSKFREGFTTIASGTGNFIVAGITPGINIIDIALLFLVLALIYFSVKRIRYYKRKRTTSQKEEVEEIDKEIGEGI